MKKKVQKETRVYYKGCNIPLCKSLVLVTTTPKNAYYKTEKGEVKQTLIVSVDFFIVSELNNEFSHCYCLLLNCHLFQVADSLNTGLTLKLRVLVVCIMNETDQS